MKSFASGLALLALFVQTAPAHAWGQTGHRVTGVIADAHLSGHARARIAQILDGESLAEASTWADEMRSNPDPFWQREAGPFHYVTVPAGEAYAHHHAPAEGDAMTALARFSAQLRDPDTDSETRRLALRFIVHIIGDLHQPLHAGRGDDRGGNDVRVTWFGNDTNLHAVWDSGLIDGQQLSYSEYADRLMRRTRPADVIAWWIADPVVWISESTALRETLYPEEARLGYDYAYRFRPQAEQRLAQAGVRIAAYLNQLFDPA